MTPSEMILLFCIEFVMTKCVTFSKYLSKKVLSVVSPKPHVPCFRVNVVLLLCHVGLGGPISLTNTEASDMCRNWSGNIVT